MFNRIKHVIAKLIFTIGFIGLFTGLMGFSAPAHADTEAFFSASWNGGAEANAEALAVAIAGADATGKILLEEEKTRSPHMVLRTLKPPTESEVLKFGTPVNSLEQAQATLEREVKTYDRQLNNAKVKVAKLKQKIKFHKNNPQKVKKLKKQLKKAQKHLKQVQTSWKYKPLLKAGQGVCGRNTGRFGNMVLGSFVDCIKTSDGELWKALGWVPELREAVVVGVKRTNGTYEAGCHNFWFFDIPQGTPDESMVIVVKSFAKVILEVAVGVHVKGDFTLDGEMRQDGKVCDTDSKTVHVDKIVEVDPIRVTETDTDRAMAFGESQVQANAQARAEVQADIAASLELKLKEQLYLKCEDIAPEPTITNFRVKNDLETDAQGQACASWQLAPGRTATLSFSVFFGTVVGERSFQVTGTGEKCVTIKAPSEVTPGDTTAGIPAGKDKVSYKLVDNASGKKDEASALYTVHPKAEHPA